MNQESAIQIQFVHGGFIFRTMNDEESKTEVFTSQGKLMKAIRTAVDEQSLVSKKEPVDTPDSGEKQPPSDKPGIWDDNASY